MHGDGRSVCGHAGTYKQITIGRGGKCFEKTTNSICGGCIEYRRTLDDMSNAGIHLARAI